jgi:hypothetical protein
LVGSILFRNIPSTAPADKKGCKIHWIPRHLILVSQQPSSAWLLKHFIASALLGTICTMKMLLGLQLAFVDLQD